MPHEWQYICYNKFIGRNGQARIGEKLSLSVRSPYLRGIRLPEEGFARYDELTSLTERANKTTSVFDFKIFYKLSSETKAFYSDPILKGTVNSIELPSLPDDVFLIPPILTINKPNLVTKEGVGHEKAQGVVNLNEYGKISSIELTALGQGYSLYKTAQIQREQSECDILPIIFADYTVMSSNLNINRPFLDIKNLLFDKANLTASLKFGVRLASVDKDLAQYGSNTLSADEEAKIQQYKDSFVPESVIVTNNSIAPYADTSRTEPFAPRASLDPVWDIILNLYGGEELNGLNELTIYNQNVNPDTLNLDDFQNSAEIKVSEGSSFINPQNFINAQYSIFVLEDLKIIPDGSPAITLNYKPSGNSQSLTFASTSYQSSITAYGALPNMKPRAEMFNKLANAVSQLKTVRVITPLVAHINKAVINLYYDRPIETRDPEFLSFEGEGMKLRATDGYVDDYFAPAGSPIRITSDAEVWKEGSFITSSYTSSKLTYKYLVHPLFKNAAGHIGRLKQDNKFIIQQTIEQGNDDWCFALRAQEWIAYIICPGPSSTWYGSSEAVERIITPQMIPCTVHEQPVVSIVSSEASISVESPKSASAYAILNGKYLGRDVYCHKLGINYKTYTIQPILLYFYPASITS